jgi:hypothetical protein
LPQKQQYGKIANIESKQNPHKTTRAAIN